MITLRLACTVRRSAAVHPADILRLQRHVRRLPLARRRQLALHRRFISRALLCLARWLHFLLRRFASPRRHPTASWSLCPVRPWRLFTSPGDGPGSPAAATALPSSGLPALPRCRVLRFTDIWRRNFGLADRCLRQADRVTSAAASGIVSWRIWASLTLLLARVLPFLIRPFCYQLSPTETKIAGAG